MIDERHRGRWRRVGSPPLAQKAPRRVQGLQRFGEIYGYLLMIFMFGSGIGPFIMDMSFKYTGSYDSALVAFAPSLVPACLVLPRQALNRLTQTGSK